MLVLKVIFVRKCFLKNLHVVSFYMDFQINNSNEELKTRFPTAIATLPSHNVVFIGFDNGDIQTYVTENLAANSASGNTSSIFFLFIKLPTYVRISSLLGGWQRLSTWEQPARHHFRSF